MRSHLLPTTHSAGGREGGREGREGEGGGGKEVELGMREGGEGDGERVRGRGKAGIIVTYRMEIQNSTYLSINFTL